MPFPPKVISKVTSWTLPLVAGIIIGRGMKNDSPQDSNSPFNVDAPASSLLSNSSPSSQITGKKERVTSSATDLDQLLTTGDRIERMRQLIGLIDELHSDEFETLIERFREEGWRETHREDFQFLIVGWMTKDPLTAISYLDENEPNGQIRRNAVAAWAAEHPESAAEAISELEDGGRVNDWIVGLVDGIALTDPESALLTLQTLPPDATQKLAMQNILPEVASRGSDYAGDWIEMVDDPGMQRMAARKLAAPLALRDPIAATEWVEKMPAREARRDASEVVAEVYAAQDLDTATKWVESLPKDTQTEAAEGVAKHLTRKNPAEAARWLQKLGNDPDLDGARVEFLKEATESDPQTALEHVDSLSSTAKQEHFYRNILKSWAKEDQEAAITWAKNHYGAIPDRIYRSVVPREQR